MAYAAKPLVEAELAVGRWRATDGVVLLARAATHRKVPSFTAWCALTADRARRALRHTFLSQVPLSRHHFA